MKTQLLLISLFLTMAALAVSQKNSPNFASPLVVHANDLSNSGHLPNKVFIQNPEATATPTSAPPEKKNAPPTRTPRPTSTPVPIPPAADPNATSLMILFGLIAVIVVIVGVWLNRSDR